MVFTLQKKSNTLTKFQASIFIVLSYILAAQTNATGQVCTENEITSKCCLFGDVFSLKVVSDSVCQTCAESQIVFHAKNLTRF